MVILKTLKKQLIEQFKTPKLEAVMEETAAQISRHKMSSQSQELPVKNAYSHGLEEIYALEVVDPKTIKKLGDADHYPQGIREKKTIEVRKYQELTPSQLELKLGSEYSSTMPSLVLNLPINVLKLNETTLKAVNFKKLNRIKDVYGIDWQELVEKKGLGQGHIEELKQSLSSFLSGENLLYSRTIHLKALLRSLVSDDRLLSSYVLFSENGLEDVVELSPTMNIHLKRASKQVKSEWLDEAKVALKNPESVKQVHYSMKQIVCTFVVQWLRKREGFSQEYEAMERLEQIEEDPDCFVKVIDFISLIYYPKQTILRTLLPSLYGTLIFADESERKRFLKVENKILSYFYKDHLKYSLKELVLWTYRELAREWVDVNVSYIQKTITHSDQLNVYREKGHELWVSLA